MRSIINKILLLIFALALVIVMVSCAGGQNEPTDEEPVSVVAIAVDSTTVPASVFAGELDVTQIRLIVTYSDQTAEMISMTSAMVAVESRTKLDTPGTKTIKVVYENCETRFQIVLLNKDKIQYTLRVYNGVPTAIDGVALDEDIVVDGEYFEAVYDEGTVVTLEWIAVSGYYFDYWTDNDKKIDTQSITLVNMNANHTYKAFSEAVINTVSFVTNCDTGVGVRRTNYLNQNDIPTLKKEGFVFDGWTTTPVVGDDAIDNVSASKITFPYNVVVETTLYGLWRVLGIKFSDNPTIGPSGATGYMVESYYRNDTELIIPDKHNNSPVIGIYEDAFSEATMLRKLTIPASIETIEEGSFKNCSQLSEIIINGNSGYFSTNSGSGVLYNYEATEIIAYPANKVTALFSVPVGVEKISGYAFYNCLIGGIILPQTVKIVGDHAFDSVHIDYVDFSVVNPNALNFSFGSDVFSYNITSICVDPSYRLAYANFSSVSARIDSLTTESGLLSEIETDSEKRLLYRVIYNENSRFPSTTSEIIGAVRTLTTLRIPVILHYIVSSIGVEAFNDCILLNTVEIPTGSKLERIRDRAFEDTPWVNTLVKNSIIANNILYKYLGNAEEYILDSNILEIAEGAFNNNITIKKLNLGSNSDLAHIGAYAFYGCEAFSGDTTTVGGGITFKDKLITIGNYAFSKTMLNSLKLQSGARLQKIGEGAFEDCYYLKSVTFASATEEIASGAFDRCYSLESFQVQHTDDSYFIAIDGVLYKYDKRVDTVNNPSILYLYPAGRIAAQFNANYPTNTGTESLSIKQIGEKAFNFSNIAALYIPQSVVAISANSINIPGLLYVEFEKTSGTMTYSGVFGDYAPEYILFNEDNAENINNFFDNNDILKTEKLFDAKIDTLLFYNDGINPDNTMVYSERQGSLILTRTSRTLEEITIPSVEINGRNVTKISSYAFFGHYLNTVNLGGTESNFSSNAFSMASKMTKLYTVQGAGVPDIYEDTFGPMFDNGLMIYVGEDAKESYKIYWNLSSYRYLIDLDTLMPTADFVGIDIGVIEPIDGQITYLTVPRPIRAGYQFSGWVDDMGNVCFADIDNTEEVYIIPYNITLTCVWAPKIYTVIFSIENNATISETSYLATYEQDYSFPTPIYDNMILLGWRVAGGSEEDLFPSSGKWNYALIEDTITLYPVWNPKAYILEYDATDEDMVVSGTSEEAFVNEKFELAVPTKTGYEFLGWYIDKDNQNNPIYITDKLGNGLLRWSRSDLDKYTVFAAWKSIMVQVSLYLQYTDGETNVLYGSVEIEFGKDFIIPFEGDEDYDKDLFCGWYDSYDAVSDSGIGTRFCDENGVGLFKWNVGSDCNLYAQWPLEVSSGAELMAMSGIQLSQSIVLNSDITLTKPIGDKNNPYSGLFNGNGYKVTLNYTVTEESLNGFDGYVGMFAINNGTIKNVILEANINISGIASLADSPLYIGGIAGYNTGKIYSVATTGYDVTTSINISFASQDFTEVNVGGLVGYNSGAINKVSMSSRVNVNVDGSPYDNVENNYSIGNTIGTLDGGALDGTNRSALFVYSTSGVGANYCLKTIVCGKIINNGTVTSFSPTVASIE
ncbi:hypothetical protein EOM82_04855 [bacterium]|nr:hypothetical protein [bacterium]